MTRIMAVNVMALVILVGSVLYLNQFQRNLIEAEVESLTIQAEIIAGALGESASVGPEATEIDIAPARDIITRLVSPTENRARLFAPNGGLLADSQFLAGDKRLVEERLENIGYRAGFRERITESLHAFLDSFTRQPDVPPSIDRPSVRASDFLEVSTALEGELTTQLRVREDGNLVINIAVPVQRFRRVLGVMLLTAQTENIQKIVRAEQMLTVKIFLGTLIFTIFLSFFLGRTLVRPIRVLARAAERVRRGIGQEERIPEFAERMDEIGDLSRSLSDMTSALYRQIDGVERFAADVAHEIKNPLSSMRSALETIQMTDKPEVQQKLFGILEDDVKRIDRLITDISDASRVDAELTRGKMARIDLGVMLNMLADAYHTTACKDGTQLEYSEQEADVFVVKGIESRLGQVWRNLIDNALSFSPESGTVFISLSTKDRFVTLTVEDEGPGLPNGAENKVFKRFYSERPNSEEFGSHSGLGLSICKQVIEAHGGQIFAENRMNEEGNVMGACFRVRLPVGL
ncbi:stimulus-sensing domain-containing protein [Kordiimonas sp. SCSIO 12603]|uniref:stimulus-sensing domain-containing protein n=1 Tax=Kordiimonas sp. SCSIO 12603 TaxID=2829596 RepID=UPI002107D79A|nr:stimulus-sensing domain-containing protein [Kordiimonas sp. SCSIO 12603]UTW58591.1 stimulus-sensing domain-containing protein [Kordiimonas sp. SCSIO 12603]